MKISDEYFSGSFDAVKVALQGDTSNSRVALFHVANSPSRGEEFTSRDAHNKGQDIAIRDIKKLVVINQSIRFKGLINDYWKAEVFRIRAKCADNKHVFELIKKPLKNKGFIRNKTKKMEDHAVFTFKVNLSDWRRSPPCSRIEGLEVYMELDDSLFSGTSDKVYVNMGLSKAKDYLIGKDLDRGNNAWTQIKDLSMLVEGEDDVEKVWVETRTIPIERVNQVQIVDWQVGIFRDEWKLKGLRLRAKCAGVDCKFATTNLINEFTSLKSEEKDARNVLLSRNIIMYDWHK